MKVKKRIFFTYFILFLPLFLSWQYLSAQNRKIINATTIPDITYQIIDGFGASDAWRCQFVGNNWPEEKKNRIANLLFSQELDKEGNPIGIGLSIWRFYLSSGTAEQGDSSQIQNLWRRGECFLNADGSYDWSKQEGQQWFLQAAKERGVEKFLAFPNAPPVHYSNNGKGYATIGDKHFNVKPGYMDDYAKYLVEVVEHFNQEGIFFDYLSPVNEPQWDWDGTGQEGTPALNEEIYAFVRYISDMLSAIGSNTKIVIGEAGSIGHASINMGTMGMESDGRDDQARFFFSKESPFYIGDLPNVENTISAHSYHSVWPLANQVEYRQRVKENLKQANPDLGYWMSEYCILQPNDEIIRGNGRDLTMKTALYVARIIHNDLTITNAKSWQWWTAISQVDYKDGLIYLDDGSEGDTGKMGGDIASLQHDGSIRESKLLWIMGNYSRFIRPGMVRIQCTLSKEYSIEDGLLVSAYKDLQNGKLVYVFTNLSEEDVNLDLAGDKKISVYTTDKTNNMKFSSQQMNKVKSPARSVVTVIITS